MDTFGIKFTPDKLKAFKSEIEKHDDPQDVFVFEQRRWLAEYAWVLAEFLQGTFMAKKIKGEPEEYESRE